MMLPEEIVRVGEQVSEQAAMTADLFNTGTTPEAEGEVYINGEWIVGHVAMRPEIYACAGLPIERFGEDATGTFTLIPGTIKRFESIPMRLGVGMKVLMSLAPAAMERTNVAVQLKMIPEGGRIIAQAGGRQAYDKMARERLGFSALPIDSKNESALVFEA